MEGNPCHDRQPNERLARDTGRSYFFGDPSAKTENFNDQSVLAADRYQIDRTRGGGSLLRGNMIVLDDPDTLNLEATFLIHQGANHLQRRAAEERRNRDRQAVRWGDGVPQSTLVYRTSTFDCEDSFYARTIPPISTVTPIWCPTKTRVVIKSEDVSATACPLPDDTSHRHVMEVFSASWTHKHPHIGIEPSNVIFDDFLTQVNGAYS
ncbi:hypothetical protein pipiens_013464 [Culex pipiens pipiens]|uniref:DUF7805 domain-containing protein n=1 Tax=Culex pipiens pipiens TaxID=38569 RepID=A0ABD1D0V3_CULPP